MNIINPIKSIKAKQADKIQIEIRISKITLLEISFDFSSKKFRLEICNLAIEI